jgi:hypothetical protein
MKIGTSVQAILRFGFRNLRCEGLVNYAVEMGSGTLIYIPSFIKIDSAIQKLVGWGDIYTHTHTHTEETAR